MRGSREVTPRGDRTLQTAEKKKLSLEERIKAAEDKVRAEQARLAALKTQANARERKDDTRRKILLGALVQERMIHDEPIKLWVAKHLPGFLTRPQDRALFDLSVPEGDHRAPEGDQSS
jgi:large subunit ribosomal protein L7/L12